MIFQSVLCMTGNRNPCYTTRFLRCHLLYFNKQFRMKSVKLLSNAILQSMMWIALKRLTKLSTTQTPVPSVRSIASDLALTRGVALGDVVTMGNWSSAAVFDTHRRQRRQWQNITNYVLRLWSLFKAVRWTASPGSCSSSSILTINFFFRVENSVENSSSPSDWRTWA